MANENQSSGSSSISSNARLGGGSDDPEVIAIVEDVIRQIRSILNGFEELVYEVWDLFAMLGDLLQEVRQFFQGSSKTETSQAAA